MKLYTKPIKVCNLDYTMIHNDTITLNGVEVNGLIKPSQIEIHIGNSLPKQFYCKTLMHEIVHAIMLNYSLDIDEAEEERFVDCMASGVLTVMRDNPDLVKFFMEEK